MDHEALRHALRPGDVVWGERVARVGRESAVEVPLRGEPAAVVYEDIEGVVVRELEDDVETLASTLERNRG